MDVQEQACEAEELFACADLGPRSIQGTCQLRF